MKKSASSHATASLLATVALVVAAFSVYFAYGLWESTRSPASLESPLVTFSADAYSVETQALLNAFAATSGTRVAPVKAGGSFADANQIAAGTPDDVFVSASLSAVSTAYLKGSSPNWAVGFASDQMVIAYSQGQLSPQGGASLELARRAENSNSTSDWGAFFTALTSGEFRVGIADPVSDPAGLRGWLVLEAAGYLYAGGNSSAYASRLLQSKANTTAPHAAALVAPLQAGQIEFLLIYKSAAVSSGLGYATIDRHVSLGDPALAQFYSRFSYKDAAGSMTGAPIVISVTVPLTSTNQETALRFVEYLVVHAGVLSPYGLQPLTPARLYNSTAVPEAIAGLISRGLLVHAGGLP